MTLSREELDELDRLTDDIIDRTASAEGIRRYLDLLASEDPERRAIAERLLRAYGFRTPEQLVKRRDSARGRQVFQSLAVGGTAIVRDAAIWGEAEA